MAKNAATREGGIFIYFCYFLFLRAVGGGPKKREVYPLKTHVYITLNFFFMLASEEADVGGYLTKYWKETTLLFCYYNIIDKMERKRSNTIKIKFSLFNRLIGFIIILYCLHSKLRSHT